MIGGGGEPALEFFDAVVLGLVEGITEFLPVSSTGHLILAQRLLGLSEGAANNTFAVGIQTGAITAILALYGKRVWTAARAALRPVVAEANLLWQIALGAAPAALLGFVADDWIDAHLFTPAVVAVAMIVGGVLLLALDRWSARRGPGMELPRLGYQRILCIGMFQCLALVPGASRSAATIAGALVMGGSRTAAAEFSFLVGLPILYGAAVLKVAKNPAALAGDALAPFLVGAAVAFASALLVVAPFVRYLRSHGFAAFAWYRIAAGLVVAAACAAGYLA